MKEIVVITGGASGIGAALCKLYLEAGARVALFDSNTEALEKMKSDYSNEPSQLSTAHVDVREKSSLRLATSKVQKEWGVPTLWINSAGINIVNSFEKLSEEDFSKIIDVNFKGVVNGTRIALEVMKDPLRGKIVNISSLNGFLPTPYMTAYVASKHAVVGLTRSLQQELSLSHSPIRVVLVLPGFVDTPMIQPQNGFELPKWIRQLAADPHQVAREIFEGIQMNNLEIIPTRHGKVLKQLQQWMPGLSSRIPRLLVSKSWRELLGLDPIE